MTILTALTLIEAPMVRCFDLSRSVEVHVLGNGHFNEQAVALAARSRGCWGWETG